MRFLRVAGFVVIAAAVSLLATWAHSHAQQALSPPENDRFYQNVEWSPDGQWIAFSEYAGGEFSPQKWAIFIARRDGSQRRLLTPNAVWATWSPDGKRLAFESRRTGNAEIFVVDADGSNVIQLTDHPGSDGAPAWSADGARIAFSSNREDNVDVYVTKTNGEVVRRLTEDPGSDYNPAWSSDGEHIVFYRSRDDGRDQIWVREVDGAREWNITDDDANNIFPCFLANGSIGFSSKVPGGSPRVFCVDADRSNRRAVGPLGAFFARWSPRKEEQTNELPSPTVKSNCRITVKRRLLGLLPEGDSELFLALEYEAWKQKKKTTAGQRNQFVAVGHSSGATAIYSLLRNGTFQNGPNAPAFLGLVDMNLPLGPHDLTGKTPRDGARRTIIVHYHTSGTDRIKGIRNIGVGTDHFSVVNSRTVTQGLSAAAANACLQNSIQKMDADN